MSHAKLTKDDKDIEKLIQSIDTNQNIEDRKKIRLLTNVNVDLIDAAINHHKVNEGIDRNKNSRKPRNGKGRGLPKKGGGGGKGTWGKLGTEYSNEGPFVDKNDPNYDSESSEDVVAEVIVHQLSIDEFAQQVEPILKEYFNHGDPQEVIDLLRELNLGRPHKPELAYIAIGLALDRKDDDKELTSVLLADLHNDLINQADIEGAFVKILANLPELIIDIPEAPTVIGNFIARAIADDCLNHDSLQRFYHLIKQEDPEPSLIKSALGRAEYLLSLNYYPDGSKAKGERVIHLPGMDLHEVWGIAGANKPVKTLAKAMERALKEYATSSADIGEAGRSLVELHVPHFHHEYVFLAVCLAIEDGTKRTAIRMRDLLESLLSQGILDVTAIEKGFERAIEYLPEMCLDVPNAQLLLEKFVSMCCTEDAIEVSKPEEYGQGDDAFKPTVNGDVPLDAKVIDERGDSQLVPPFKPKPRNRIRSGCFTTIITKDILSKLPNKGRKRFVSEGDGGLLKYNVDTDPFK